MFPSAFSDAYAGVFCAACQASFFFATKVSKLRSSFFHVRHNVGFSLRVLELHGPCRQETPTLQYTQRDYPDVDVSMNFVVKLLSVSKSRENWGHAQKKYFEAYQSWVKMNSCKM